MREPVANNDYVVVMNLAARRRHPVVVKIKIFNRIDMKVYGTFKQARLIAIQFIGHHLPEGNV